METQRLPQIDRQEAADVPNGTAAFVDDAAETVETPQAQPREREVLERGATVGRYVVTDLLGRGGMGVVYKAYDPDLDRRIALKLLRVHGDSSTAAGLRDRLLAEAQALAQLSHPNVVTVHDVGTSGEDVFIAMELVEGQTVRKWLKNPARRRQDILAVYLAAGAGLAGAHEAGLVHRDFKPDNVIVGDDGRVRVLDFGLARTEPAKRSTSIDTSDRSTASPATARDRGSSADGPVPVVEGTPYYMSPEQLRGAALDAKSDQFSFCVALFEALYGERPFVGPSLPALRRAVLRGEIQVPRQRSVPNRLHRILLRGLSVSPGARYRDMHALLGALAADPWATWRRIGAIAGTAGLAAGSTAALLGRVPADVCAEAAIEASAEPVWSEPRAADVASVFEASGRPWASDTFARIDASLRAYQASWSMATQTNCEATHVHRSQSDLLFERRARCLQRSRDRVQALVELFGGSPSGEVVDNAVRATMSATDLQACERDDALLAAVPEPDDPEIAAAVAKLEKESDRVDAMLDGGRYQEAHALAQTLRSGAESVEHPPLRARIVFAVARGARLTERFAEAKAAFSEAVREAARAKDDDLHAAAMLGLLAVTRDLAAYELFDELVPLGEAAVERTGDRRREFRGRWLDTVAYTAIGRGRYDEALGSQTEAVALLEAALGRDHPDLAKLRMNLGTIFLRLGRHEEGRSELGRALEIVQSRLGPQHPEAAPILRLLGLHADERGDYAAMADYMRRAYAIAAAVHGDRSDALSRYTEGLAVAEERLGHPEEALAWFRRTLAAREHSLGPAHPLVGMSLLGVANQLSFLGRHHEALSLYERALGIVQASWGDDHHMTAWVQSSLAECLELHGRYAEAKPLYEATLRTRQAALGAEHPEVALARIRLAHNAHRRGAQSEALGEARDAVLAQRAALPADHADLAAGLVVLGELEAAAGHHEAAALALGEALDIRRRALTPGHVHLAASLLALGRADLLAGAPERALPRLEEALRICEAAATPAEMLGRVHLAVAEAELARGGSMERVEAHLGEAQAALGKAEADVTADRATLARLRRRSTPAE